LILSKKQKNKRRKPPSHAHICNGQIQLIKELDIPIQFADSTCWACKREFHSAKPEKAHIEPFSRGGSDLPSNFLLLCRKCHASQPDAASREYQLKWLRSRKEHWETDSAFDVNPFATEFKIMSGISIEDFCNMLMDKYGTSGMLSRFKNELKMGSLDKAGQTSGNAMANAVARLVLVYETEFK
tara:strand:+ start:1629 stop:2180 length:552 start_codon:yes stop_codon:yes gene_type:complete